MAANSSLLALVILGIASFSMAEVYEVPFRECDGSNAPSSLRMDCTQLLRGTCILERGKTYNMTVQFTPERNIEEVESRGAWKSWVEMPLYGQVTEVCEEGYLACPLAAGQPATFTYPLHIHSFLMRRRYPVIWRLKDTSNSETVVCFHFSASMV